jgi:hypothetical protein
MEKLVREDSIYGFALCHCAKHPVTQRAEIGMNDLRFRKGQIVDICLNCNGIVGFHEPHNILQEEEPTHEKREALLRASEEPRKPIARINEDGMIFDMDIVRKNGRNQREDDEAEEARA